MAFDSFPAVARPRYAGASTMLAALVAYRRARGAGAPRGFSGSDWVDAAAAPLILPAAVLVYYLWRAWGAARCTLPGTRP